MITGPTLWSRPLPLNLDSSKLYIVVMPQPKSLIGSPNVPVQTSLACVSYEYSTHAYKSIKQQTFNVYVQLHAKNISYIYVTKIPHTHTHTHTYVWNIWTFHTYINIPNVCAHSTHMCKFFYAGAGFQPNRVPERVCQLCGRSCPVLVRHVQRRESMHLQKRKDLSS